MLVLAKCRQKRDSNQFYLVNYTGMCACSHAGISPFSQIRTQFVNAALMTVGLTYQDKQQENSLFKKNK